MAHTMILIFSLATPLGTAIGLVLSDANELTTICCSCLAAGTFFYIAASEIVVEEFSVQKQKWLKYFMFLFGACFITALSFFE